MSEFKTRDMRKNIALNLPCLLLCLVFGATRLLAQESPRPTAKKPLVLSVFNTGTQLPGSVFTLPVHPGFSAGTEFRLNHSSRNQWFQTAKFGLSWHRYVQTAIQLYTENGYRRSIWRGTAAEFRLGAGYLHSIPAVEQFTLQNGVYETKNRIGRPQMMLSTAFGLSYTLPNKDNPLRFFLDYQFYLQLPFVKSYVPMLPNTALHAGVALPIFQ